MGKYDVERVERLEKHLQEHPTDYQAVIAYMIARSDMIEHQSYQRMIERKKRVAEIRKKRKEMHDAKERDVE